VGAYEEALAYDTRAVDDLDVIHKFRSACRRLRFTLELFEARRATRARCSDHCTRCNPGSAICMTTRS